VRYRPFYLANALEVRAGPAVASWLASRPEVGSVLHNPVLRPLPAPAPSSEGSASAPTDVPWNLELIRAPRVWRELGVDGTGIVIGQSDSGAQWDHPELRTAYRGGPGEHAYNWLDPWYGTSVPTDRNGHGTHTLGTAVGQSVGVAPGAQWYACVNLARNMGSPALYLECMQFMLAPYPPGGNAFTDGLPARGAHVINNSWGCPRLEGCDPTALVSAARALRVAGLFVVSAAGNEGERCGTVSSPLALYDAVLSVGAIDATGQLAFFSSRGPVQADGSGRVKPDLVAPGVQVLSAYPGNTYYVADGTSMASPHVAGVVALIWSANPGLIGNIDRTEQILFGTAQPYAYAQHGTPRCGEPGAVPSNAVGHGIVDAYAAVQRAMDTAVR
jgi:subtilisin family serine protease